jgi:predicted ATPase
MSRAPPHRLSSPRIVGRADVLAALSELLEDARGGRPRAIVLVGEAGIGKTRLARETAAQAEGAGMRVLWGDAVPLGVELPYGPLAAALRAEGGGLATLLPESDELVTGVGRTRLFERMLDELRRLAPLLLVVEDAHWADASTRDALASSRGPCARSRWRCW